jgi:hypothetical protein
MEFGEPIDLPNSNLRAHPIMMSQDEIDARVALYRNAAIKSGMAEFPITEGAVVLDAWLDTQQEDIAKAMNFALRVNADGDVVMVMNEVGSKIFFSALIKTLMSLDVEISPGMQVRLDHVDTVKTWFELREIGLMSMIQNAIGSANFPEK